MNKITITTNIPFFKILLVFTFFVCCLSKAQSPEKYNALYVKTYLETSQSDFPRAIKIADSLYSINKLFREFINSELFNKVNLGFSTKLFVFNMFIFVSEF